MNWLIKLLGGVTASDFTAVFSLAAKDREVMMINCEFYKAQCDEKQKRIDYLENLILTKVGYIAPLDISQTEVKEHQPIGGSNSWPKVKHSFELRDKKIMQERTKNAR